MSIETTGRSKDERSRTARPQRVIRLARLPAFLGLGRTAIQRLVDEGRLHPFSISGRRAKVVTEDEVIKLQKEAQAKAGAGAEREDPDAS